jgi:hypothetical protein
MASEVGEWEFTGDDDHPAGRQRAVEGDVVHDKHIGLCNYIKIIGEQPCQMRVVVPSDETNVTLGNTAGQRHFLPGIGSIRVVSSALQVAPAPAAPSATTSSVLPPRVHPRPEPLRDHSHASLGRFGSNFRMCPRVLRTRAVRHAKTRLDGVNLSDIAFVSRVCAGAGATPTIAPRPKSSTLYRWEYMGGADGSDEAARRGEQRAYASDLIFSEE